jgi:hypothetical protein
MILAPAIRLSTTNYSQVLYRGSLRMVFSDGVQEMKQ